MKVNSEKKSSRQLARRSFLGGLSLAAAVPFSTALKAAPGHHGCPDTFTDIFLNVRDFGAGGDWSTDDTNALKEAIAAAADVKNSGLIFLPPGIYRISDTLKLPSGVHLIGCGQERTILRAAPGTLFPAIKAHPRNSGLRARRTMLTTDSAGSVRRNVVKNSGVSRLTLDWNQCPTERLGHCCLLVDSADNFLTQDVDFIRCMPSDHPGSIDDMSGSAFRCECVMFSNSRHCTMDRCLLTDSGYRPLSVSYGSRDITFQNSHILAEKPVWRHSFLEVHGDGMPRDESFVRSELRCLNCTFTLEGGTGQDGICCHTGVITVENCDFRIKAPLYEGGAVTRAFDGSHSCVYKNNRFHASGLDSFTAAFVSDHQHLPDNEDTVFTGNILKFSFTENARIPEGRTLINVRGGENRAAVTSNAIKIKWSNETRPVINISKNKNFTVADNRIEISALSGASLSSAIAIGNSRLGRVHGNSVSGAYSEGLSVTRTDKLIVTGNNFSDAENGPVSEDSRRSSIISGNL